MGLATSEYIEDICAHFLTKELLDRLQKPGENTNPITASPA